MRSPSSLTAVAAMAAAAAGAAATDAGAATYPVARPLIAGPVLGGTGSVWLERQGDEPFGTERVGNGFSVIQGEGASARRELALVDDPEPQTTTDATTLVADADRIAVAVARRFRPDDPDPRVQSTPTGSGVLLREGTSAFAEAARCDGQAAAFAGAALPSGSLVTVLPPCEGLTSGPPGGPRTALAAGATRPAAEGSMVAWLEGERRSANGRDVLADVVVFDLAAGRAVTRVTAAQLPGAIRAIDVDTDGTLAVSFSRSTSRGPRGGVAIARPGGSLRSLRLPVSASYAARVSGGRIVALRSGASSGGARQLLSATPTGRPRVVVRGVEIAGGAFDTDGTRIAWTTLRCRRVVVRTATLRALARRAATPPRCVR